MLVVGQRVAEQQDGGNLGPCTKKRIECVWFAGEGTGHWQVSGEMTKGREGSQ